ncbi:hypothetical protein C8J56DRAFT_882110 [Mycena floridula]|nr:hypothetical protein C8J56DRAFT_882110 [Mycena floridula]
MLRKAGVAVISLPAASQNPKAGIQALPALLEHIKLLNCRPNTDLIFKISSTANNLFEGVDVAGYPEAQALLLVLMHYHPRLFTANHFGKSHGWDFEVMLAKMKKEFEFPGPEDAILKCSERSSRIDSYRGQRLTKRDLTHRFCKSGHLKSALMAYPSEDDQKDSCATFPDSFRDGFRVILIISINQGVFVCIFEMKSDINSTDHLLTFGCKKTQFSSCDTLLPSNGRFSTGPVPAEILETRRRTGLDDPYPFLSVDRTAVSCRRDGAQPYPTLCMRPIVQSSPRELVTRFVAPVSARRPERYSSQTDKLQLLISQDPSFFRTLPHAPISFSHFSNCVERIPRASERAFISRGNCSSAETIIVSVVIALSIGGFFLHRRKRRIHEQFVKDTEAQATAVEQPPWIAASLPAQPPQVQNSAGSRNITYLGSGGETQQIV